MSKNNYKRIINLAIPVILANASVPLLGIADTAALGQTGVAADLGAIALATLLFNFVYWGFGFLRMGTTGFIAQSIGAKDRKETDALLFRSLSLGLGIGLLLICLQKVIGEAAIELLNGSQEIKTLVQEYFYIRIWGAPATLVTFSLLGTLIGAGWTRQLLIVQIFLNGLNIFLNLLFVLGFDLGIAGIALGTLIAEWMTLFLAFYVVLKKLRITNWYIRYKQLFKQIYNRYKIVNLLRVNTDIMIRTLALLSGFAWFANQGASFGDSTLAANHVLLQFVSLSAFFLDGYANVVEMLTGKAYGEKNQFAFSREVKDSTLLAAITATILAAFIYIFGEQLVSIISKDHEVQQIANSHLIYASIYVALSFAAFQLDGIFIGVTKSKEMRNATLFALFVFLLTAFLLVPRYENNGLWISFITYVIARAIFLGSYYPRIIKQMKKI